MWNAKADGLHSTVFMERVGITRDDIERAERRARELQGEAIRKAVRTVFKGVKSWFTMRQSRRELLNLDDRMLKDIGLSRSEIEFAVGVDAHGTADLLAPLKQPVHDAIAYLKGWAQRRSVYAELSALDEHMLEDIGIVRSDIQAVVSGVQSPNLAAKR